MCVVIRPHERTELQSTPGGSRSASSGTLERLSAGQYFGRVAHCDVAGFGLAELTYRPGDRLRPHAHERDHFVLVIDGRYEETVGTQAGRRGPADVMFLPRDVMHSERHETAGRQFALELPPDRREGVSSSALHRAGVMASREARRLMGRLHGEFRRSQGPSPLMVEGLAILLLAELDEAGRHEREGTMPRFVRDAEEFVRGAFTTGVSLADVAAAVGVDPWRLSLAFRRWKGCSVGEYVRRAQVDFVCDRLQSTDDPVATVAHAAGFCDHSHCCRVFKDTLSMTPREFKTTQRQPKRH
jgi:AraC family transcriptional regulator